MTIPTRIILLTILASTATAQSTKPAGAPAAKPPTTDTRKAAEPKNARDIQRILKTRIPKIEFKEKPLQEVFRWVQKTTGAHVYVKWAVLKDAGIPRDKPITLKAESRRLELVLWLIMNEAGGGQVELAYQADDELIIVSTHHDLGSVMYIRVYDVKDLRMNIPDFGADGGTRSRRIRHARRGGGEVITGETPSTAPDYDIQGDERMLEIIDLILTTVEPDTWELNGRGGKASIFPFKGKLVVRASLKAHQTLGGVRKTP